MFLVNLRWALYLIWSCLNKNGKIESLQMYQFVRNFKLILIIDNLLRFKVQQISY